MGFKEKINEAMENIEYAIDLLREAEDEREELAKDIEEVIDLLDEALSRLEKMG